MVVWFVLLVVLAIPWILQEPRVFGAIDPRHAVTFFATHGLHGFAVLGAVFLVVTGGEALYADMGHFGKRPIRLAWFALVLPALLINYFGQGAMLLLHPDNAPQAFFLLAPRWALYPVVAIASAAAIIASQALISGAFSLTRQAIQLGYFPRLDVEHTSHHEVGQIYVPQINWMLAISTILIVIGFRSSGALAAAYGIAVTMTMVITVILLHVVATERWKWPLPAAWAMTATFLTIDVAFFGANVLKIREGGWLPLAIGAFLFTLMTTWKTGRRIVAERLNARAIPLEDFVAAIAAHPPPRVSGTAVFMTAQPRGAPPALAHNLRYNKILHEHVIVLMSRTAATPFVDDDARVEVQTLGHGITNVVVQYGFMEDPDIPKALELVKQKHVEIDADDVTFFLGARRSSSRISEAWPSGARSCSSSWRATPRARRRSSAFRRNEWSSSVCRLKCEHQLVANADGTDVFARIATSRPHRQIFHLVRTSRRCQPSAAADSMTRKYWCRNSAISARSATVWPRAVTCATAPPVHDASSVSPASRAVNAPLGSTSGGRPITRRRHVDRARQSGYLGRRQTAAGIHAIGNNHDRSTRRRTITELLAVSAMASYSDGDPTPQPSRSRARAFQRSLPKGLWR